MDDIDGDNLSTIWRSLDVKQRVARGAQLRWVRNQANPYEEREDMDGMAQRDVLGALVGYTNYASPELEGASAADDNILKGTAQPWLRCLDGLNTHDDAYPLSIAVVTTALILPGSANSIGVQALVIKLRHTEERSPSSMLLGPPY
ncbi:uncharacterized protein ARMOST_15806 [Armillaria ostoyae]|uniref:Uncharacterized protein n=1 Tax=Armillaria ostoyae TaxID=47428 RepID=A0A284RUG8_ARMOS|nr:uncharacterized protein ARMOST_15806 [Armillaria ostoyae]